MTGCGVTHPRIEHAMHPTVARKFRIIAFAMMAGGVFVLITAAVLYLRHDVGAPVPMLIAAVGLAELLFGVMLLIQKGNAR